MNVMFIEKEIIIIIMIILIVVVVVVRGESLSRYRVNGVLKNSL